MTNKIITQKRLKKLLHYDPITGVFVWLVSPSHSVKVGSEAGTLNHNGYIHIRINGKSYQAQQLAFLYMVDSTPKQVDHDNHIRSDNRWNNLNPATYATNGKNQSIKTNNVSGMTGVCYHKASGKWQALIMVNGKRKYLGLFTDKIDAIKARKEADINYGFHKNHGK